MAGAASTGEPMVSINVTPFVDVVLVLLVIFMATSSYLVKPAIDVSLPKAASGSLVAKSALQLTLGREGDLYLNGKRATAEEVAGHCRSALLKDPKLSATIAADGAARHEQVVALIDLVQLNGVSHFALSIERSAAPAAK